jgi:competence protein ComEC
MRWVSLKILGAIIFGLILGHFFNLPGPILILSSLMLGIMFFLKFPQAGYLLLSFLVMINWEILEYKSQLGPQFSLYNQDLSLRLKISGLSKNTNRYEASLLYPSGKSSGMKVLLVIKDSAVELSYGDIVETRGSIKPLRIVRNPGFFDYQAYFKQQGFIGTIRVSSVTKSYFRKTPYDIVDVVRQYINKTIAHFFSDDFQEFLLGILLGQREIGATELKSTLNTVGLTHLFAVSGLHVSIIVTGLILVLRVLRIKRFLRLGLLIGFVGFYLALVEFRASAVRAGIMSILALLGFYLEEDYLPVNGLFVAAIVILLLSPQALFEASFQMSFLTTLGIILGIELVEKISSPKQIKYWIILPLTGAISANLFVIPLIAYYFFQITPYGAFVNFLALPVLTFIFPLALIVLIFNLFFKSLALFYAQTLGLLIQIITAFANWARKLPGVKIEIPRLSGAFLLFYYLGFFLIYFWSQKRIRKFLVFSILILANLLLVRNIFISRIFNITFLDTKTGESIIFELPNDEVVIIDAGENNQALKDFLYARGVRKIKLAVITHPHYDHYGGFLSLVDKFKVDTWLVSTDSSADTLYQGLIKKIRKKNEKVILGRKGLEWSNKDFKLQLIYPSLRIHRLFLENNNFDLNNLSLVSKVTVGEVSFLLGGDLNDIRLLDKESLNATILKAFHHGSRLINNEEVLRRVKPEYLVVCGQEEASELESLASLSKIKFFNTRKQGGITFQVQNQKLLARTLNE